MCLPCRGVAASMGWRGSGRGGKQGWRGSGRGALVVFAQCTTVARGCVGGQGGAQNCGEWVRVSGYMLVSAAHVFPCQNRGKHGWVRGRLVPDSTPIVRSTGPEQNGGTWVRGWSRWGAKQLGVDPSARILASQSSACVCQCGDSMDRWVRGRLADWSCAVHCHWPTGTWVRGWSRSCAKLLKPAGT